MIRYLSRSDVASLGLTCTAIADAVESALRAEVAGHARNLPKMSLALADGRLYQSILAAGLEDPAPPYAAVKVVGLAPGNEARGLPHIAGVIVLLDRDTGRPLAIMDASWITAHRTAALSLVAGRRLARKGAARIGFVACGAQAEAHLAAFAAEFPIRRITAYSRRHATAEAFAAAVRGRGLEARAVTDPAEAVRGQDIVVTSVPAAAGLEPFLDAGWLEAGAFAALVDLGRCWRPSGFAAVAHVVTDDHGQVTSAKRKMTPEGPYHADLKELVSRGLAGQRRADDRAVLVFQGLAIGDLVAAALAYERAEATASGVQLER